MGLGQADKGEGSRDPSQEAGTQGRTCGSGRDLSGDSGTAEGPSLLSAKPQDVGTLDGDQRDEAKSLSPKESKKRKLEGNRQEQVPEEPDPQGVSEVEKIALNLEECALSPISQEPREAEQPCPMARVANEVRKRRKVEEGAEGDGVGSNIQMQASGVPPTPSEGPESQKDGNESEDPKSQVEPEDPKSQVGPEDPKSQVGPEDSKSQVGPEDPKSQVGPDQAASESLVEDPRNLVGDPNSDTTGTPVDESEELARIEASAEPPKP